MVNEIAGKWGYVVVWEFRPIAGTEERFEEAYGPRGAWARLFAMGEGFVGTELNQDLKDPTRYLTLDFWESKEAYEAFRAKHAAEYIAIDRECEALTAEEKALGAFERIVAG
jgi:heme-degrading monooxygenase HmoA